MKVIEKNEEVTENVTPIAKKDDTVTQQIVDTVQAEFDATRTDNKKKVYGIEVKTEATRQLLLDYLNNDIEWDAMQAYGVPKVYNAIAKEKVKDSRIYLAGLEVEALAFYLSKGKGKGKESAERFILMNDAVNTAYELRAADNKTEYNLGLKLDHLKTALKEGIASADDEEK